MQVSTIVLCVLLAGVLCPNGQAVIQGSNIPRYCCEKYSSRPFPRKLVNAYELTSSSCALSAVIFITKKGQKICANPEAKWTQKYVATMKSLEVPT